MATLVLSTVGTMVAGPIGGLLGSLVGQTIDQQLLGGGPRRGPRLGDLSVQTSSYGSMVPRAYGVLRVAGTVVWATELKEESELQGDGKSQPETVVYTYSASFAVTLSSRQAQGVGRIWADGKLIRGAAGDFKVSTKFRFLPGSEGQAADPLIASVEGAAQTPAYRGLALAVFEDLQLAEFGNRIPSLTFELIADEDGAPLGELLEDASRGIIRCEDERLVPGYALYGQDIAAAVAPIVEALAVELRDDGDAIRAVSDDTVRLPVEQELGAGAEDSNSVRLQRTQLAANRLPTALNLTYYDSDRDYQAGQARSSIPSRTPIVRQVALACVLEAGDAKAIADMLVARAWAMRDRLTVRLPPRYLDLSPGTFMRVPGVYGDWIVENVTIERLALVAVLRPAWRSAGARLADPGRAQPQPDVVAIPTRLALFDFPDFGIGDPTRPTLHLAAASPSGSWRRVPIEITVNGAKMSSQAAVGETILGTAETVLSDGQPFVIDLVGSLEVLLANPEHWLQSRDDAALVDGANLAVVGDEIIQFGRADPIGPGRFRLSRLVRGRRGTEWAMAGHVAGEPFALIEARSLKPILVSPEMLETTVSVTAYGPANSAGPPTVTRAAGGEALRPLSPAHVGVALKLDGTAAISWVQRNKLAWAWLDEVDVPVDPGLRGCRVTLAGSSAMIERDVVEDNAIVSAAELATLGAGPVSISVRQIGELMVSRAATVTFTNP